MKLPKHVAGLHAEHPHLRVRSFSRRQFIVASGAAGGAAVTSGLWMPLLAEARHHHDDKGHEDRHGEPRAIPGLTTINGLGSFHFFFPSANPFSTVTIESGLGEPSLITDFRGAIGVAELEGPGIGAGDPGLNDGAETALHWKADLRFMTGHFRGTDGRIHEGSFGFI